MHEIKVEAEYLEIMVQKSKQDQYHQGNKVYIAKINGLTGLHALLSRFYSFTAVERSSAASIFRSLASFKTNKLTEPRKKPISYPCCREIIKKALATVGENPNIYDPHSLRSGGAIAIA